ncbi:MAG: dihydrolipoyl dehydrogenase [Deltaproteobacteria bacterium]|nr:dihydrolipoyl dehydrogenase [Deltaproteobacteria bacterium]
MIYDMVVIGAGPGGHAAALEAASLGASVAIVEKEAWGGTCVHWGCIPTKTLLACSGNVADIKKLKRMGISVGEPTVDLSAMKRHQHQMVRISELGVRKSLEDSGVRRIEGEGTLSSPGAVTVTHPDGDTMTITAQHTVIAWGSQPAALPFCGFSDRIISSREILSMETLPERLVIVGGGAIGVELATIAAELGSAVTIIELMDQLLPNEERDAAELLTGTLKKRGVEIYTSTSVESIEDKGDRVEVRGAKRDGSLIECAADYALICIGRKPVIRTVELEKLGIAYDRRGVLIDGHCMTNIGSVYAVGDVTGGVLLAHRAATQGRAVASHIFGNGSIPWCDDIIPAVVYTHPSLARVGLTEAQARTRGIRMEVIKGDYGGNIIARTEMMGKGFVKMIFHDDRLIGVTIVGEHAADLIASMSLAVANGMTKLQLQSWVIPHPTLSELLNSHIS